jgi:hypothetical protein
VAEVSPGAEAKVLAVPCVANAASRSVKLGTARRETLLIAVMVASFPIENGAHAGLF